MQIQINEGLDMSFELYNKDIDVLHMFDAAQPMPLNCLWLENDKRKSDRLANWWSG